MPFPRTTLKPSALTATWQHDLFRLQKNEGLARWSSDEEHQLHFQRTQFKFPAPTLGGSRRDLYTHDAHTHIYICINKSEYIFLKRTEVYTTTLINAWGPSFLYMIQEEIDVCDLWSSAFSL